jgi:hypothetical protein
MLDHVRRNGVAYLALFVALSGTTYAAVNLPAGSVGSKQLRKHAVIRGKLARGAVTKATLAKGAVTKTALATGVAVAGPRGAKGDPGARGAVGPTQGFASQLIAGAAPSATPDATFDERSVKTATAGRLFVFLRGSFREACTAGTVVKLGIYLDDSPVPASGAPIGVDTNTEVSIWGLTGVVAAGTHAIAIKGDCTGGNRTDSSESTDAALAAIVLGG